MALNEARGDRKLCFIGHNIEQFDLPLMENELRRYESCCELLPMLGEVYLIDTLLLQEPKKFG